MNKFSGDITHIYNHRKGITKIKKEPYQSVNIIVQERDAKYPQEAMFTLFSVDSQYGNKVDQLLEMYSVGDGIEITYKHEVNHHGDNHYHTCRIQSFKGSPAFISQAQ